MTNKTPLATAQRVPPEAIEAAVEHLGKLEMESAALHSRGILVNYVKPVVFNGNKAWALGSEVFIGQNPNATFHEFTLGVLKTTLGQEWGEEQLKLPRNNVTSS